VLAEAQSKRKEPWQHAADQSVEFSRQVNKDTANQYYQRLVKWHQDRVERAIRDPS
jgi:hypothetical protein